MLNKHGILIVKTVLPYETKQTETIVVLRTYAESILTLMHYKELEHEIGPHPNASQLSESAKRKFFIFDLNTIAEKVVRECKLCESTKKLPKEAIKFRTDTKTDVPGTFFNADVLNMNKKKILVLRDNLTSFTQTKLIENENRDLFHRKGTAISPY